MSIGELTKSGPFVLALLVAALIGVPFGADILLETLDEFLNTGVRFPVRKTVKGWFAPAALAACGNTASKPVDWERYRKDLEEFTAWADGRSVAVVSHPTYDPAVIEVPVEVKSERQIWLVPVTSCAPAGSAKKEKTNDPDSRGYVFVSGFDRRFVEGGDPIEPTRDRCGYEIVSVGERSVWFRAVFDAETDTPMGIVRFPEFTRVDGESLVRGSRKYVARDAFTLASGGWLMIDSFLPPDGTVFKIIDENYREVASLLCVIIGEKGGK